MAERAACKGCGGEKDAGHGYRYCASCREKKEKKRGRCIDCGEVKKPGKGTAYCEECLNLKKWANDKRKHFKPQRLCKKCKKVWVSGVKWNCEACRNPVKLCSRCHTRPTRGHAKKLCELCYLESLEAAREYQRKLWHKKFADPAVRQKRRERDKLFHERLVKDKERLARRNESRRLWWRRTHAVKPLTEEEYKKGVGKRKERLPAEPLRLVIEEYLSKGGSINGLAKLADVVEKRLREVYHSQVDTVLMSIADKVCVTCGTTLEWVYDDQAVRKEIPLDGDYDLDKAL